MNSKDIDYTSANPDNAFDKWSQESHDVYKQRETTVPDILFEIAAPFNKKTPKKDQLDPSYGSFLDARKIDI